MALLPERLRPRPPGRHNPGPDLRGEDPLREDDPTVELRIPLPQAQLLHSLLEDALEDRPDDAGAHLLRLLSWRILAVREGSGLTGRLCELARAARTLEAFEAARDEELGPILDALENDQNRDP